jgi:hypothetical protein
MSRVYIWVFRSCPTSKCDHMVLQILHNTGLQDRRNYVAFRPDIRSVLKMVIKRWQIPRNKRMSSLKYIHS